MIQTSTPAINVIEFRARHAKIISSERSINGKKSYVYEITITCDTALALLYNLTKVIFRVHPLQPGNPAISKDSVDNKNHIVGTSKPKLKHLDLVGKAKESPTKTGGDLLPEHKESLTNTFTLPGFGGGFDISPSGISHDLITRSLSYALNFEKIYFGALVTRQVAEFFNHMTRVDVSINAFINSIVSDNYKASIDNNATTIAVNPTSRGIFQTNQKRPDVSFYSGEQRVKMIKPKGSVKSSPGPNLTTVVNNAYGYSNSASKTVQTSELFERGHGNTVKAVNSQTGVNDNNVGLPKGITNMGNLITSIEGENIFIPDYKTAAMSAIFNFGIAPSMIVAVNVENSVVSIMQNYQGTSNLKNNGA